MPPSPADRAAAKLEQFEHILERHAALLAEFDLAIGEHRRLIEQHARLLAESQTVATVLYGLQREFLVGADSEEPPPAAPGRAQ